MKLKELSDLLGISQTTISRALNGFPEVNINTKKRVQEAAKKYGYTPSSVARRLAGKKVEAIGIIQPIDSCLSSPFIFLEMVGVLSKHLRQEEIDLFVVPGSSGEEIDLYERMIAGGRVDSFIVEATKRFDSRIKWLLERKTPFVCFGRSQIKGEYSWIDFDHRNGLKKAADALIDLGHRRLAFINQGDNLNFTWERKQGLQQSVNENNVNEPLMLQGNLDEDSGFQIGTTLLDISVNERPSAIICSSMLNAKGVLKAIEAKGLRAGEDVSVIAWDDGIQEFSIPGMSVIEAPIARCSKKVAEFLMSLARNNKQGIFQELLEVDIILRDSVAPRKAFQEIWH